MSIFNPISVLPDRTARCPICGRPIAAPVIAGLLDAPESFPNRAAVA